MKINPLYLSRYLETTEERDRQTPEKRDRQTPEKRDRQTPEKRDRQTPARALLCLRSACLKLTVTHP